MKIAKFIFYAVLIGVTLFVYASAEANGWASGGQTAPEPIQQAQLRNTNPGSWTYLYWAHGVRGK